MLPNRHLDAEYAEILPPSKAARLDERFELALKFKQPDVDSVATMQLDPLGDMQTNEGFETSTVQRRGNGEFYTSIVPRRLGNLTVHVSGVSRSGAIFWTSVILYVEEPAKTPSRIAVTSDIPAHVLYSRFGTTIFETSLQEQGGRTISAEAFYEDSKEPFLINPSFIRYRIWGMGNQEVITMDQATGRVRPVHVGHAILEASYGGLTRQVCVVVTENVQLREQDRSNCSELLPPQSQSESDPLANSPPISRPLSISPGNASSDSPGNGSGRNVYNLGNPSIGLTGNGVMHVGGSVKPPRILYEVEPEFTEAARKAKYSGNIEVYLWVDEQGNPSHIRVARGIGMGLDEKAIQAVQQYKFKPATQNGIPVKVDLYIDVNFQLF